MAVTRREFLVVSGILAVTAGCAKAVPGSPAADPAATERRTSEPDTTEEEPPDSDKVVVGIIVFPPYTVEDGGELTGPVPDVARAVLEKLDITDVKFMRMQQREQIQAAMQAGELDFGAGVGIRPEVCESVRFTEPDHVSGTAFVVPTGNPKKLTTYAEVTSGNARLGVLENAPEVSDSETAGVPAANLVRMPDPMVLLQAVRNGEIDCFAFDDLTVRDLVKQNGDGLEVTAPFLPESRPPYVGAYLFPEESRLFESFNDELRELHESGEWRRLVEPFGFTEDNEPPSDMTTEKLCSP